MRCPACGEDKDPSDFPRNRTRRNGLGTYCKPCHARICSENRAKNHGGNRQFQLLRRYNLDEPTFNWLSLQQNDVCAICQKARPQHVDHDHETGEIRALLCFTCNGGLGKAEDDPQVLRRALAYVLTRDAPG